MYAPRVVEYSLEIGRFVSESKIPLWLMVLHCTVPVLVQYGVDAAKQLAEMARLAACFACFALFFRRRRRRALAPLS